MRHKKGWFWAGDSIEAYTPPPKPRPRVVPRAYHGRRAPSLAKRRTAGGEARQDAADLRVADHRNSGSGKIWPESEETRGRGPGPSVNGRRK